MGRDQVWEGEGVVLVAEVAEVAAAGMLPVAWVQDPGARDVKEASVREQAAPEALEGPVLGKVGMVVLGVQGVPAVPEEEEVVGAAEPAQAGYHLPVEQRRKMQQAVFHPQEGASRPRPQPAAKAVTGHWLLMLGQAGQRR